eukprot:TRINITY_DN1624_c1_g1_i1.p1 TRINITY_DN1624_c1_g1~~TRINITY_DN1624_c1_g1_i1.p1  ORF type:complete len:922 (+),score=332.71 TRINITY_DN1624_c1_g1_i1:84-2768(+)
MAPPAKKQKTEEEQKPAAVEEKKDVEMKKEEPKKIAIAEPPKEHETDAPKTKDAKIKESVNFLTQDTTMNVMTSADGNLLMSLSDGGIRHLLAGARANVGVKSGRYMFEVKIVELAQRAEDYSGGKTPPKAAVKIGFSTAGSSLLMGEETDIFFDFEGALFASKKRINMPMARFAKENVVAVLLNLDKSSPNANTISLFKDGKRVCQPQALPEALQGKTLYPTVTYRGVTVLANFGSDPLAALPFTCTMIQDAVAKDAEVTKAVTPKDGKYEVIFPVCVPDEGGFDWLDAFKKKHPGYVELSDRSIIEWAMKSGIMGTKGKVCNDKPGFNFGIRDMDDFSIQRMLKSIAPLQQRNFIVMEVKGNLIKENRAEVLGKFFDSSYKKIAQVMVGDPSAEFKKYTQELLLAEKQKKSDQVFRVKQAEEANKRAMEKRQKELEKTRKKREKELKKIQAAKAKAEAEKKAAAEGKKEEAAEEKKEEEPEEAEEEEEEVAEEPVVKEDPPKVTLDDDEKKVAIRKLPHPDMESYVLNTSFTKFTVPEQSEGFDEVRCDWNKGDKATQYMKKWVLDRKQTSRIEDLIPSAWFHTRSAAFNKALAAWQKKQSDYKALLQRKAQEKAAKAAKKAAAEKAAALKAAAEKAKKEKAEKEGKPVEEEKKEEEKAIEMEVEEEKEEPEVQVDFEGVDIFGVGEVNDIGGGMPLFKDFASEDWALMSLCFELHLLAHAFKKDCNDEERAGVHLDHLGFYYNKYYKKNLVNKQYGCEKTEDLVALAKDVVMVNSSNALESLLDDEMEYPQVFVKIAEEARRHRAVLLDMGEESAKLKFQLPAAAMAPATSGLMASLKGGAPKGAGKGLGKALAGGFGKAVTTPTMAVKGGKGSAPYPQAKGFGKGLWKGR